MLFGLRRLVLLTNDSHPEFFSLLNLKSVKKLLVDTYLAKLMHLFYQSNSTNLYLIDNASAIQVGACYTVKSRDCEITNNLQNPPHHIWTTTSLPSPVFRNRR